MSFTRLGVAATRPPQFPERGERVAVTLAPLGSRRPLAAVLASWWRAENPALPRWPLSLRSSAPLPASRAPRTAGGTWPGPREGPREGGAASATSRRPPPLVSPTGSLLCAWRGGGETLPPACPAAQASRPLCVRRGFRQRPVHGQHRAGHAASALGQRVDSWEPLPVPVFPVLAPCARNSARDVTFSSQFSRKPRLHSL